jgi:hypothetical protein
MLGRDMTGMHNRLFLLGASVGHNVCVTVADGEPTEPKMGRPFVLTGLLERTVCTLPCPAER